MNSVEPIRDKETVAAIADFLYAKSERDYVLFMVGINTGLRISDILTLKVSDVKNRKTIVVKEQKTGKVKEIPMNEDLRRAIREYTRNMKPSYWLFPSQKGHGARHILRSRAYKILKQAAQVFGLSNIGTHTLRKTFGYHFYYATGKDVMLLMYIFGHTDPNVTLRYIGVTNSTAFAAMKKFSIMNG